MQALDTEAIECLATELAAHREKGRLFVLGIGGSAANASHAVNDFRKLCGFEAYAPTDNVAELSAWTNDEGWESTFVEWLLESRLGKQDAVLMLSVGGGSDTVSQNLVQAAIFADNMGAGTYAIVGKRDGLIRDYTDILVVVPNMFPHHLTPHAEEAQAIVLHCLVSHPLLKQTEPTWERLASTST